MVDRLGRIYLLPTTPYSALGAGRTIAPGPSAPLGWPWLDLYTLKLIHPAHVSHQTQLVGCYTSLYCQWVLCISRMKGIFSGKQKKRTLEILIKFFTLIKNLLTSYHHLLCMEGRADDSARTLAPTLTSTTPDMFFFLGPTLTSEINTRIYTFFFLFWNKKTQINSY